MASLSDQIDRLSRNTRSIRSTAAQTASIPGKHRIPGFGVAGPFTCAVLNTDLGDLIRDIDPSELGLFSLLTPPGGHSRDNDVRGPPPVEISRAEFSGATPLRKAPPRRDDAPKPREFEPEIYAQAALKYIDRYQPIRPMPRAHSQITAVLERLTAVRKNIQSLNQTLQQIQAIECPTPQPEVEGKRLQGLQLHLAELKRRKHAATSQHKPSHRNKPVVIREKQNTNGSPPSPHEDNFWNTPAAAVRTLRFSDNLMDDNLDLNDITTTSFMSPMSATLNKAFGDESIEGNPHLGDMSPRSDPAGYMLPENPLGIDDDDDVGVDDEIQREHIATFDADEPDEDEKTVVLPKPSSSPAPQSPPQSSSNGEYESSAPANLPETSDSKHVKVRINSEVERIVERIWTAAGDIIMPGYPFEVGGQAVNANRLPRAKETIAHLQSLSALPLIPDSPSASSISSISAGLNTPPTSQQILTACLLLSLLTSPSRFSVPLNKVKDLLASKAKSGPGSTAASVQGTTRIIYGCVAKRLVKIERGGSEQIVKFDV